MDRCFRSTPDFKALSASAGSAERCLTDHLGGEKVMVEVPEMAFTNIWVTNLNALQLNLVEIAAYNLIFCPTHRKGDLRI
jgi:hypothetical protein